MMNSISSIIVEDEKDAQEFLVAILKKDFPNISVEGMYDNVKDAAKNIQAKEPELIFMDIELIDGNAFDILDNLQNHNFEIIFISAHSEYIEKSLDYHAFNYITKPFEPHRLYVILQRYIKLKERLFSKQKYVLLREFMSDSKLFLNTGNEHMVIDLKDVMKCVADGNYCRFHMIQKNAYLSSESLKYYEQLLEPKGFFRANRSTLVNIRHIHSIYKKEAIILSNKERIRVSVRTRPQLTELIKSFT
ncbi:LytR/AlgR family response regulator transcription factor [Aquimarina litoralis]|uniref:LytR/AlgR family response regulator transcription factor n=1 Tax=Aquimarina litoralis TaxID=584605 RepID=UPI001C598D1B|nr:LytTR family DNA-binding domain-containing protein [Aquimarina litoralis]MBW1298859.1 response regulator [Aquimarina litoralis]